MVNSVNFAVHFSFYSLSRTTFATIGAGKLKTISDFPS